MRRINLALSFRMCSIRVLSSVLVVSRECVAPKAFTSCQGVNNDRLQYFTAVCVLVPKDREVLCVSTCETGLRERDGRVCDRLCSRMEGREGSEGLPTMGAVGGDGRLPAGVGVVDGCHCSHA